MALTVSGSSGRRADPPAAGGDVPGTLVEAVIAAACAAVGMAPPSSPPDGSGPRLVARAARAAGAEEATDLLVRAADVFERAGSVPTACWLRLVAARALAVRGRPDDAASLVRPAKAAAEAIGADHLRRTAVDLQRALAARGPRGGPQEELSLREADIVHLVCGGLSNRDIAARLFISAKTVECHLTRIFRKMEVRSRSALVARMAARSPAGG